MNQWFFVYGALMGHPKIKKIGKKAVALGYQVDFRLRGERWIEPCFATLHENPKEQAWGVAVHMTQQEFSKISGHEVGYSFKRIPIQLKDKSLALEENKVQQNPERVHDNFFIEANAFFPSEDRLLPTSGCPSARYSQILLRASLYHKLPSPVTDRYRNIMDQGSRVTQKLFWIIPLLKFFIPRVPGKSISVAYFCVLLLHLGILALLAGVIFLVIER